MRTITPTLPLSLHSMQTLWGGVTGGRRRAWPIDFQQLALADRAAAHSKIDRNVIGDRSRRGNVWM